MGLEAGGQERKNKPNSSEANDEPKDFSFFLLFFFFSEGVLLEVVAGRGIILMVLDYQGKPWRVDEMMVDGDGDGDGAGMCCNR